MSSIEVEAKTMDEAISRACEQLGRPQDQLEIEVVSDSAGKMFGIISAPKVKIRASIKNFPPKGIAEKAKEVLEQILGRFEADTQVEAEEDDEAIILTIKGDGSGILIGRKGQTLDALQYIVNKIVHRLPNVKKQITVDTEGYRERRKQTLIDLAKRLSQKAKAQEVPVSTNPLSPFERRIIHLTIQDDEDLTTQSKGDGVYRRVIISPKKTDQF